MITTTLMDLEVAGLHPWGANPRKKFRKAPARELEDSLRAVGVLQPLVARPKRDDAGEIIGHEVVAGERRLRAAKVVGLRTVPCTVRELTDKEAIEIAVMENGHRDDLDVVEEAGGYQAMVQLGWSVKEICDRSGRSEPSIYGLLDLLKLDDATLQEVRDGTVSVNTARALGRIADETKRGTARERVTKPTTQVGPLSEKLAVALIKADYLEPQRKQEKWQERKGLLARSYPGARIAEYDEAHEYLRYGSGWVDAKKRPEAHELAVHVREGERVIPTWGELARTHAGERVVVPGQDGEPVEVVNREALVAAEVAAHEEIWKGDGPERVKVKDGDAGACIFPMGSTVARHAQAQERKKEVERKEVDTRGRDRQRTEFRAGLLRYLKGELIDSEVLDGAGMPEDYAERLLGLLLAADEFEHLATVAKLLGVDVDAMEGGAAAWARKLAEERGGVWVTLFLLYADVAMSWPVAHAEFEEELGRMAAAVGFEGVPSQQNAAGAQATQ